MGIYLGQSPQHGQNVALVLDRQTGLVSPQFHVVYDHVFDTVKQDKFDMMWEVRAGFVARSPKQTTRDESQHGGTKQALPLPEGVSVDHLNNDLS